MLRYPTWLIVVIHITFVCVVTIIIGQMDIIPVGELSLTSLNQWDADWFYGISKQGYTYDPEKHSSVAFFPLFPYIWRWSGLSWLGICIFNGVLFSGSLLLYFRIFKPELKTFIAFLCTPMLLYFFVPYSESVFFVSSVVLLTGIKKENPYLISAGLFLSVLSRYAAMIFLPAIIITMWWQWQQNKTSGNKIILSAVLYTGVLLSGLFLVSWIQYSDTGIWTGYMQTHIHWGHYFRLPELPFYSAMGSYMVLLDQLALLTGVISGGIIIYAVVQKLRGKEIFLETDVMFALSYLSGVSASMILFQGGSLDSLSRYVFGTFFFYFFIKYVTDLFEEQFSIRIAAFILLGLCVFFMFCGSLNSTRYFIIYSMLALNIVSIFVIFFSNLTSWWAKTVLALLYFAFLCLQSSLLWLFLRGEWIA